MPTPTDTLGVFGLPLEEGEVPTMVVDRVISQSHLPSEDKGGRLNDYRSVSAIQTGHVVLALRPDHSIVAIDLRDGKTMAKLPVGLPRVGIAITRTGQSFYTLENRSGWNLIEYNFPEMTEKRVTPLGVHGVTIPYSLRLSGNARYAMIGHFGGVLVLNTIDMVKQQLVNPPVEPVYDSQVAPSVYAIMSRQATSIKCHIVNNGEPMEYVGKVQWLETSCCTFNWDDDSKSPYPHFVVGGWTTEGYQVIPYQAGTNDFSEMNWKITLPEMPRDLVFSEQDRLTGSFTESTYGRALGVVSGDSVRIYDLTDGSLKDTLKFREYGSCTAAVWKQVEGEEDANPAG